jgi:DNA-binding response OmpR family regulator
MPENHGPLLVIEDIPNVLELLEVTLKFQGYQVLTAMDGEQALKIIQTQRPALVITDILMPVLDGFAFVQKLRSDPETQDIPVIFLSATYVTPEDREFALSLGAASFIEKPFDTHDFLLTIAELLSQESLDLPQPLAPPKFYSGYRARLENKLKQKNRQIVRIERLLPKLDEVRRNSFQTLYDQAVSDRDEIQRELYQLKETIKKIQGDSR